jgi:hypothetical protein
VQPRDGRGARSVRLVGGDQVEFVVIVEVPVAMSNGWLATP